MDYIKERVALYGSTLHIPPEQTHFIFSMFLSVVFGYINRCISNPKARLIYGLVTGLFLQFYMNGYDLFHLVVATLNTYLFIKFFGRKYSAFFIIVFNISHLSYLHIKRMIEHYGKWTIGVEAAYMMSICKFSSIGFNYEDGAKSDSELKYSYHRDKKIIEKPKLLEVFSFIFYYPTAIIGPSFEFSDFMKFIHLKEEYANIPYKDCTIRGIKDILTAMFFLFFLTLFAEKTLPSHCGSKEYGNSSLLYKLGYFYASMFIIRCKYYAGFKISQASPTFCGLNYQKFKPNKEEAVGDERFDRITSIDIYIIEFYPDPRIKINNWNISVHKWLKYYVYLRLVDLPIKPFKNNKSLASLLSFIISALWHGFYPVYYIFFFHFFLAERVAEAAEKRYKVIERLQKSSPIYYYGAGLLFYNLLCYIAQGFAILTLKEVYNYFKAFYFVPNLWLLFVFIYLCVLPSKKSQHDVKREALTKEEKSARHAKDE